MSWEEEPGRLAAVARSVGCELARRLERPGEIPAWVIHCPTRWHTVALLDACAWEDSRDPELVMVAAELAHAAAVDAKGLLYPYILAWTQRNIPFVDEPIETFIGWREVLRGGGDCDDLARFVVALVRALDGCARLATIEQSGDDGPIHVAAQVWSPRRSWLWMEATVPGALIGEPPRAACLRLGIPIRPDLG